MALPAELTSFVGRERDVSEVRRLLDTARLVTLTGVGGVGKTRLALRVAAGQPGVRLAELSGVDSAGTVVHAVAEAVRAGEQELQDFVRDKTMLLVLDNCEHLVEACADLARTLLQAAPNLTIMATSRQSLGVPGEHLWRVAPLPEEEQAVLFAHRATAVEPGFAVTWGNQPDLAEICRKTEGIPLAIELAAVWLRTLSVRELAQRLDESWPGTQATVQWSYDLCTPREQALWAELSVFAGGFDVPAVEAVCGNDVLPALDALVDKSVVTKENQRHRLLGTLREFGMHYLNEPHEVRRRHRDHYLALAERLEAEWFGPDQRAWQALLRAEHDNLRSALEFCLATPDEVPAGMRMITALWFHWHCGGLLREYRHWLDLFVKQDEPTGRLLAEAGRVASYQGDLDTALRLLREARAATRDDPAGYARATEHLAVAVELGGKSGTRYYDEALATYDTVNDPMEPLAQLQRAMAEAFSGDPRRGREMCERMLRISEQRDELWVRSYAHQGIAHAAWRLGRTTEAEEHAKACLRIKSLFGDMMGTALALELLGWIVSGERAAVLLGAARNAWQSFGLPTFGTAHFGDAHNAAEARLRGELGEKRFAAAFQRGEELSADQAVAHALHTRKTVLTTRERQVAELVAEGMTNKQIAAQLVISQRTVESHVEQIRAKLGLANRAQLAAWTARGQ